MPTNHDPKMNHARVGTTSDARRRIIDRLVEEAEEAGYPVAAVFAVRLAVEEALANAARHGHADRPDEPLDFSWLVTPARVDVEITDHGPGFNPEDTPDPTLEENIGKPSGRGLMLMRAYMTDVAFNESGNTVRMTYFKPAE